MRVLLNHISRYDWLLVGAVLLLVCLGLITLFSLSESDSFPYFQRQMLWAVVGLGVFVAASFIDFQLFRTQSWIVFIIYALAVLALVAVLAADFKVRGVESWLRLGENLYFQPVEFAKISLIILLAKFFSKRHIEIYRIRHLVVSGAYLIVPALLVLIQPDLGSAVVLIFIWATVVVFSGMKLRHLIILLFLALVVNVFTWNYFLEPYQRSRVTAFINPYSDPKGAGYQMIQSMIAVGSGKMWGKGLGYGSQSHLKFLPEPETDFIFAAYAEEWGFAGVLAMLVLFLTVLWRIIKIGRQSPDNFSRLYSLGLAAMIFVQAFIHAGMNMGILPITGITLPFVSYGGSSLITLFLGMGILQNIKINARRAE